MPAAIDVSTISTLPTSTNAVPLTSLTAKGVLAHKIWATPRPPKPWRRSDHDVARLRNGQKKKTPFCSSEGWILHASTLVRFLPAKCFVSVYAVPTKSSWRKGGGRNPDLLLLHSHLPSFAPNIQQCARLVGKIRDKHSR